MHNCLIWDAVPLNDMVYSWKYKSHQFGIQTWRMRIISFKSLHYFKVFYNYKSFLFSFFCCYHRVHNNISGIVKFISLCEAITYSCIYMSWCVSRLHHSITYTQRYTTTLSDCQLQIMEETFMSKRKCMLEREEV